MAGHYTLTGDFQLISEEQGTLYNVGISDIELSSDATKGQGILLRSGETQAFKGTIYARSYDESGSLNVQNFIELPGGGDGGGGGGGGTPYTLPTMSQNVKGGAKIGAGLTMTGEVLSLNEIYIPSAVVSKTATGAILTVSDHNGTTTASIKSGADGEDGETPTISTASIEGGNSVTFGTSAGFWTINIYDGKNGTNGTSPTVSAETIAGGNAVTFTSAAGMATINIMDGASGANGIGVTMTTDSIEGGTALKMHSASGFVTVNVYNGKDGAPGADGKSFEIKAQYATEAALIAAHPTGQAGDAYLVGDDTNPDLYIWLSDSNQWQNSGPIAGIVGPKGDKGDPGVGARVALTSIPGGTRAMFTDAAGSQTVDIMNGVGVDGVSPTVAVSSIVGGHSVTITDEAGAKTFSVLDGADGRDGQDVAIAVSSITGGHNVTLTGAGGSKTFAVMDGVDGDDGVGVSVASATVDGGNSVTLSGAGAPTSFMVYDGQDGVNGVSPIVSFATIPDGHVMTVSDAQGQKSITIPDGKNGMGVPIIDRGETYRAGDIGQVPGMASYLRAECVTEGTTATTAPAAWSTAMAGQYVTDGTAVFVVDDIRDGTPVGRVVFDSVLRPGYVRANGATIQSASVNYPRLIAYLQAHPSLLAANAAAQAANLGLFLYNSGTNTLTMCNYIGRVMQGGAALASVEAGLPEISGKLYAIPYTTGALTIYSQSDSGAISVVGGGGTAGSFGSSFSNASITTTAASFAASRSNPIYGGSTTVQPPAIVEIPQIRY